MKDSQGTHGFDGSEHDNKATSLHNQFLTQLSISSSNDLIMNGEEVPSVILNWPLKSVKQDATNEEVIKWRLENNGFPFVLSDSECDDSSLSEQSSTISTPSTPFTVQSDAHSEDLDRTDIWVSSLDLDAEDSALLPGKEQFPDILSSDFPSPTFSAVRSLQFGPSSFSAGSSQRKEDNDDSDEPIFWPFERTCYNSPEFDMFLSVSPRRNTMDMRYAEVRQLNPVLQRLHKNKLSSAKKSIELHRGTTNSGIKGTTEVSSQEKIQKAPAVPSRLSRTAKASASAPSSHQVPSNCQRRRPPHLKLGAPRNASAPRLQTVQPVKETGALDIQKLADKKKSRIEELIGLDEFDGHEGMGSDSPDNQFCLWLSPRCRIEESIGLDEFDGHEGIGSDSPDYQFRLWLSPRCHDTAIKHEPSA